MAGTLLDVRGLTTEFRTLDGTLRAVDRVSVSMDESQVRGLVGESGCGKSVTAFSVLGLLPRSATVHADEIEFDGEDLLRMSKEDLRHIRGNRIGIIFQEPMTALNPALTIGVQISEPLVTHRDMTWRNAAKAAVEMLDRVGIPDPARRFSDYPHQLSGGMRQRAMIAMALICNPRLLIADEPTTALDVTVQAQILDLIEELRRERQMAVLLITHNLGIVAEACHHVSVMYAGQIVEEASVEDIFDNPRAPYTIGLLRSVPRLDVQKGERQALPSIPGNVPNPLVMPRGCRFHPRCEWAEDICAREEPPLEEDRPGHMVRCFFTEKVEADVRAGVKP